MESKPFSILPDDDENHFWLLIWSLIVIAFCCLVICITSYNISANNRIAEAIEKGVNPIDAACAYNSSTASPICTLRAATPRVQIISE